MSDTFGGTYGGPAVAAVPGVGPWREPKVYAYRADAAMLGSDGDPRVRGAVLSIGRELVARHHLAASVNDGRFGPHMAEAVGEYQARAGLVVDRRFGPETSRSLFGKRARAVQRERGVPANLVVGLAGAESNWDPGAEGAVDDLDKGIVQWNLGPRAHPEITVAQAYDAQWSLVRAARDLVDAHARFLPLIPADVEDPDALAWTCAAAAHQSPGRATLWARYGREPDDELATYVSAVYRAAGRPPPGT